jgi:hypothetical protein
MPSPSPTTKYLKMTSLLLVKPSPSYTTKKLKNTKTGDFFSDFEVKIHKNND